MALSYREKSLYASLAAELLVYLPYFFFHHQNSIDKVAGMIAGIIVLQLLLQGIIALFTRNRMTDERDQLIALRGYRAGYITLAFLMILGLAMLWFHFKAGHFPVNNGWAALHFLSAFFGMLVIADISKTATQIVSYRRAL
jgi:hypothetical protein